MLSPPPRRSRAGRASLLLRHIAKDSLSEPAYLTSMVRAAIRAAADRDFEKRSPLSWVSQPLLDRIYSTEIVLPPLSLLEGGNQSVEGLIFLASLARALRARMLFEIGTYNGLTAWTLARNLSGATVNTLDLPPEEEAVLPLGPGDAGNRTGSSRSVFGALEHSDGIVQHWGDSAEFDFSPWSEGCDLVYVDGAHSEEYVTSDTENALRMVSQSGAIVWDDYWRPLPEVTGVLDSRRDLNLLRVPGTRLVVMLNRGAREHLNA